MATKKRTNRCWPGYEPTPGKEKHEQGSCRPKAKSKLTSDEKRVRAARRKELDQWKKTHPTSPSSAAQGYKPKKRTAKKKSASSKPGSR